MKNKVSLIGLFVLSASLIGSDTSTSHYKFSGKDAVDYLIRTGKGTACDLSNQDLREAIAAANLKNRERNVFIDLDDANLEGANLEGTDLSCAEMKNANLRGANLKETNLADAMMTGVHLDKAIMIGANLSNTEMKNADLSGANLTSANMRGAHMYRVNMTDAITKDAVMTGVYYLNTVIGYISTK